MECSDKGCSITQEHHETLYGEKGYGKQLEAIRICLRDIKLKKVGWVSLVMCLAFVIGTFGYGWYRTTANAENIPELKTKTEKILEKTTSNEGDIREIKKDIDYNTERIDKLITYAEKQQTKHDEMFKEILKRLPVKKDKDNND